MSARGNVRRWRDELEGTDARQVLAWASGTFGDRVAFASSLGLEDQVVTDLIAKNVRTDSKLAVPVFTLDTGRLFSETYDLVADTASRYGIAVRVLSPDTAELEEMVALHGVNLFRDSIAARKRCCAVRKLGPLARALSGLDAWVTGLRREQSVTRTGVEVVEWDEGNGLVKINPLWNWTEDDVRAYVAEYDVPYNPLHDIGFPSIGCAPCTRPVAPGEDPRSGRWWWESAEQRECGLHAHRSGPADEAGHATLDGEA